jgi:hypothetical protein
VEQDQSLHVLLIFSGSGPLLVVSSFDRPDDPQLVEKLRSKGIARFIAYEVDIAAARHRYAETFDRVAADLAGRRDVRALDFNGHQIMANLSLEALGAPVHIG